MDPAWEQLHDGQGYKVYRTTRRGFGRYTVASPAGNVVECCTTLRGARRAIRKHRRKGEAPKWWQTPIVHTEP